MSIVQLRSSPQVEQLNVPFPPMPTAGEFMGYWASRRQDCELLVYPPGFVGNIGPQAWQPASNYLLSIDDDGERAELMAVAAQPGQRPLEDIIEELRAASPDQRADIRSMAVIDVHNQSVLISNLVTESRVALAGIVSYADAADLSLLRSYFPEASPF